MKRRAGACLLLAVALASLAALSGGLPEGTAGAATAPAAFTAAASAASSPGAPPWESAGPYPAAFDLRAEGRLTPVRSQDSYSTCWIMAAMGSLESAVLSHEGLPLDFSENNLANHMSSRLDYEGMAPSELALAYYARWEGPVRESSDPYPRPGKSPPYLRAVRHLQEALFLPRREGPLDNDAVKWAVMTHGGVDAAVDFRVQDEFESWNDSTSAYFNATRTKPNHHILVVGWDDAYPASRFLAGSRPPGDGAFLVKNSWGTDWPDDEMKGYCWVSYHDATVGDALVVFSGVEPAGNYDAVYQYDALGRSRWITAGGGEQAWFANRFTSAGSGRVAAVSFYAPVPGTAYQVRVARALQGVAAAPDAVTGTLSVAGYHTVRLEEPAAVTAGETFVVAVRVTTPGWAEPVPVEAPSGLISPRARAGQSYVSADGSSWTDLTSRTGLSRANVCLKAFVDAAGAADRRAPRVEIRGDVVRRGAQAVIRWRLTDPAFSSASAVVELSLRDAVGRLIAHRRIPAVAVGERGVWALRANWPRGRYSVRGRAYDVAGGRQTTASRAAVVVGGVAPAALAVPRR